VLAKHSKSFFAYRLHFGWGRSAVRLNLRWGRNAWRRDAHVPTRGRVNSSGTAFHAERGICARKRKLQDDASYSTPDVCVEDARFNAPTTLDLNKQPIVAGLREPIRKRHFGGERLL
jgi:hypothetical protein